MLFCISKLNILKDGKLHGTLFRLMRPITTCTHIKP